jgi:hypothetical protein
METTSLALLDLLERILGRGTRKSRGNYQFVCPFHVSNPPGKKKLEVNLETSQWSCFVCRDINKAKGKKISTLLKKIDVPQEYLDELKIIRPNEKIQSSTSELNKAILPKEFISLNCFKSKDKLEIIKYNQVSAFLKGRGVSGEDILKYNLGFCIEGNYADRVIVPSYDAKGKLNYFIARDFTNNLPEKYKNPNVSVKDVIGFELYINWNAPIILVEGVFDALTIKRNVIPLFGKVIHEPLMKKIMESKVNRIYICLDNDAQREALRYVEQLMSYGKEVYLIELIGKDANEIGQEEFFNQIENISPMNFQSLLYKKLTKND